MAFFLIIGVTSLELRFHGVYQRVIVQQNHVGMEGLYNGSDGELSAAWKSVDPNDGCYLGRRHDVDSREGVMGQGNVEVAE